jgi:PTS system mannose-specific IIC component
MHVIGNQKLLPFFFLGYFLVVTANQFVSGINAVSTAASLDVTMSSITTVTWAAFGIIIAFLYTLFTAKKEEDEDEDDED